MKDIFQQSLERSYSYEAYRSLVKSLLASGKSTGPEQSADLLNYSMLNDTRMNRLDKTLTIPSHVTEALEHLEKRYIWLVISEGWCGDAAQLVPIMNKMAILSPAIDLKIVLRDENEVLMQHFLTNGGKAIPKLIVLDAETYEVVGDWGPRPQGATKLIQDYKAQFGIVDQTAKTELQKWYLQDKGLSTMEEILELIKQYELNLV